MILQAAGAMTENSLNDNQRTPPMEGRQMDHLI
jgi:hypothetical protein